MTPGNLWTIAPIPTSDNKGLIIMLKTAQKDSQGLWSGSVIPLNRAYEVGDTS